MTVTTAVSPPASASPGDLWYDSGNGNRRNECVAAMTWAAGAGWSGTHASAAPGTWPGGSAALVLTADGTGVSGWLGSSPAQPVSPGDAVAAEGTVFVPQAFDGPGGTLGQAGLSVTWLDGSSTPIGSPTAGPTSSVPVGTSATVGVTGTAPAGAASFLVQAGDAENSPAGTQMLVQGVRVSTWTPYPAAAAALSLPITGAVDGTTVTGAVHLNYSTSPGAAGTLISSVAGSNGTDSYGNAYLAGVCNYTSFLGTYTAVQLLSGGMKILTASGYGGPYTQQALINYATGLELVDTPSGVSMFMQSGLCRVSGAALQPTGSVYAQDPANAGTNESWHSPTLPSGASGTLRYQLVAMASNLQIQARLTFSPPVSGTVSLFTLPSTPSGYRPAGDFRAGAACGSAGSGTLEVTTGGVVQVLNVPSGTTEIDFSVIVPLN